MRSGERRFRVSILAPPVSANEYGQPDSYTEIAERDAAIYPVRGAERWQALKDQSETTHRVNIRYDALLAAVAPEYRIRFKGRVFEITSILNVDELNRELQMMCKEVH